MNCNRSIVLFATACFFAPAAVGLGSASAQVAGTITSIVEPTTRQVVQRRDDNVGNILVIGTYSGNVNSLQARSLLRPGMPGTPIDWTFLEDVTIFEGYFVGIFRQPAGGFYDLQIRPVYDGQLGQPVDIFAVGVGEVFLTAGQSNATNWALPTGFVPDLRVSSFNPGPGLGIDPSFKGASWQYGIDPQPVIDASNASSAWPTMATNLAETLGMPIGLYSVGFGGTSIEQWLPGTTLPATATTPQVDLFERLTKAISYLNGRGGVRAVLWDQGESDFGAQTAPAVYQANLRTVIEQSRQVTGVPIKWMVAQAAYPTDADGDLPQQIGIEQAQAAVVDYVLTFPGPNTDSIGLDYRYNSSLGPLHFNATGIVLLGGYWGIYVANVYGFLSSGSLP